MKLNYNLVSNVLTWSFLWFPGYQQYASTGGTTALLGVGGQMVGYLWSVFVLRIVLRKLEKKTMVDSIPRKTCLIVNLLLRARITSWQILRIITARRIDTDEAMLGIEKLSVKNVWK